MFRCLKTHVISGAPIRITKETRSFEVSQLKNPKKQTQKPYVTPERPQKAKDLPKKLSDPVILFEFS